MRQTTYLTRYYGIDVIREETDSRVDYWIIDANGCDEHFDHFPTEEEIDLYRNRVI